MIQVVVYGKDGCCLCEEAKAVLQRVQRDLPFELTEVDIESSPELTAAYAERIPFIVVNGVPAFKFHLTEAALRRRLRREQDAPRSG